MARYGRTTQPSTRLGRTTARYEGEPPRSLAVGTASSEEYARPVNRAPGEVRRAAEYSFVRPVGRVRSRTVGTAVAYDTVRQVYDKPVVTDVMFGEAISATDRQPVISMRADWNRDGQFDHPMSDLTALVESVTVARDLTSILPAEVGLYEGSTSAGLKATLGGYWPGIETPSVSEALSPYRSDSPLYGKPLLQTPIQVDTGYVTDNGPRYDRRFTGTLRSLNPTSGNRTLKIEALDPAHRLRRPVTVAGVGLYEEYMAAFGPDAYRARINTQWLIDHALRRQGIYASPPARDDAILSATGHGSYIPEIGSGGAPQEYFPTYRGDMWTPGVFGMLRPQAGARGRWWLQDQLTAAAGTGFGMSMWLNYWPATGTSRQFLSVDITPDKTWYLTFGLTAEGRPYFGAIGPSGTEVRTSPTAWSPANATNYQDLFIGAHVTFAATTMTVRWRITGQDYTSTATIPTRANNWKPDPVLNYVWEPVVLFQMWKSTTPPTAGLPWQGETWQPMAALDPGANELTGIPELLEVDAWELIKAVCAAEGSRFEFSESGFPQFRSRIGDAARGTPAVSETITANRNLSDLVVTTDESSIRNIVTVKTKRQLIGTWEEVFKASAPEQFDTPPGTTVFDVPLDASVYDMPLSRDAIGIRPELTPQYGRASFVFGTAQSEWSTANSDHRFAPLIRCCIVYADSPYEITDLAQVPTVYIRVVRTNPWTLRLRITNYSNRTVRFATPWTYDENGGNVTAGEPALVIPGRRVKPQAEQVETYSDQTSIDLYGPSVYDVGGSSDMWRQTPDQLRELAAQVLATTKQPMPVLDAVDVPHDPRRRIGQRIVLADPDGLGTVTATIVGLSTTYASQKATDRITVRPVTAPG